MSIFESLEGVDPRMQMEPRPADSIPEFEGSIIPAWIPPLCNIYTEDEIYVWYRFVEDLIDVSIEDCAQDFMGRPPEWLNYDGHLDMSMILGLGHGEMAQANWAIEHGLAPGQPFLICVEKPRYSTDYWGESDMDQGGEFLRAMPCKPERAARSWERVVKNVNAFITARDADRERLRLLQRSDTSAYCLRRELFYTDHYDEMAPPNGVRIHLCSLHTRTGNREKHPRFAVNLVSGEDRKTHRNEVALEDLYVNIAKYCPTVDLEAVKAIKEIHHAGW